MQWDLNDNVLSSDTILKVFSPELYGLFLVIDPYPTAFTSGTKYVQLKASYIDAPQYNPLDYNNTDYTI